MDSDLYRSLLQGIHQNNILPVISACNTRCVFCSHRQNPPGLKVYNLPALSGLEILELAEFLDPIHKIVVGESVTRIGEGEPFLHGEFLSILTGLRRRFPATPIQITTNGIALTKAVRRNLAALGQVELVISLNSVTPQGRRCLMGQQDTGVAVDNVAALAEAGLAFAGSMVAMPHLVGWEDLAGTSSFLRQCGATTVRIFTPGFTRYTAPAMVPPPGLAQELAAFVAGEQGKNPVPLILEPPSLQDLTPEVLGIIPHSPAARAGVLPGDVIASIDGEAPFSRVDAFQRAKDRGSVRLGISRKGKETVVELSKNPGQSPGFVVAYDLDPRQYKRFSRALREGGQRALVATGEMAAPLIQAALRQEQGQLPPVVVLPVPNRVFGGNIQSAGLLVVEDLLTAIKGSLQQSQPETVYLPALPFDHTGRDLLGRWYGELEEEVGVKVELVD